MLYRTLCFLLFVIGLTNCELLDEQSFSVTGSEIGFTVPEQYESKTFIVAETATNPDFAGKLKDRGLPVSMLTSIKFESLTLRVSSDDPNFGIGAISDLRVALGAGEDGPQTIATGSFLDWEGNEALLTVADIELLDYLDAETADYQLTFTVTDLPATPVNIDIDPVFQVTTSVFN